MGINIKVHGDLPGERLKPAAIPDALLLRS